ncbi:hypothetical protein [Paraburkholderia caledonica]|uniref:hypothetical protein n=1 Tax=Paraburkholderia caledonica TaxID=134536 RepID=UPI0011785497|nr:hypothetical protein [Paraburkholderia caledonica]
MSNNDQSFRALNNQSSYRRLALLVVHNSGTIKPGNRGADPFYSQAFLRGRKRLDDFQRTFATSIFMSSSVFEVILKLLTSESITDPLRSVLRIPWSVTLWKIHEPLGIRLVERVRLEKVTKFFRKLF